MITCESSRRKRTQFTCQQKQQLLTAYDSGLNSTCTVNHQKISALAETLELDETAVKNWINNEKCQRKRKATESPQHTIKKQPQTIWHPNAYNIFVREFYKSQDGKAISSLKDKNRVVAQNWKSLSEEEKQRYYEDAKQGSTGSNDSDYQHTWKETSRIIRNLNNTSEWADKCKAEVVYMVCYNQSLYIGGTTKGKDFLQANADIGIRYMNFVGEETNSRRADLESRESNKNVLRKALQTVLNTKYALATGIPTAHVPYASIKPSQVIGFPDDIAFGPPSSYGVKKLQKILDVADDIRFEVSPIANDQISSQTAAGMSSVQLGDEITSDHSCVLPSASSQLFLNGHTSPSGSLDAVNMTLNVTNTLSNPTSKDFTNGDQLKLLNDRKQVVATGIYVQGDILHGESVPENFLKVAINDVMNEHREPLKFTIKFDDHQYLSVGIITAWPCDKACKCI